MISEKQLTEGCERLAHALNAVPHRYNESLSS